MRNSALEPIIPSKSPARYAFKLRCEYIFHSWQFRKYASTRSTGTELSETSCSSKFSIPMTFFPISRAIRQASISTEHCHSSRSRNAVQRLKKAHQGRMVDRISRTSAFLLASKPKKRTNRPSGPRTTRSNFRISASVNCFMRGVKPGSRLLPFLSTSAIKLSSSGPSKITWSTLRKSLRKESSKE